MRDAWIAFKLKETAAKDFIIQKLTSSFILAFMKHPIFGMNRSISAQRYCLSVSESAFNLVECQSPKYQFQCWHSLASNGKYHSLPNKCLVLSMTELDST